MELLTDRIDPNAFFDHVSAADSAVLLLDYDGTLAPFREDRDRAVPYSGVRERLEELVTEPGSRTVLISGRPVEDVLRLTDLEGAVEVWGTHGWERRRADGTYEPPELPGETEAVLDAAERYLREELHVGERCERKPASVALHVRSVPDDRAEREVEAAREHWSGLLDTDRLAIEPFDGGLELRVAGRDKGDAVDEILEEVPGEPAVAYLGDDWTDEDAFEALGERGLRVLVRESYRDTAADWWIEPPEELLRFLDRWTAARRAGTH